jgi:putative phosphoribosyl transferase
MVIDRSEAMRGPFTDRASAGELLAERLSEYRTRRPVIVGLPRGGVAVAAVVARTLHADLDIAVVRKIGAPGNPELAIGAVGEGGVVVENAELVSSLRMQDSDFSRRAAAAADEVRARVERLRADRTLTPVRGRLVIIVDDGIATGATAEAAVAIMRARGAAEVVVAAPVGAPESIARISRVADRVVCVDIPPWLGGVGAWYRDFTPVSEDEIARWLHPMQQEEDGPEKAEDMRIREVAIRGDHHLILPGTLRAPADPIGIVVFAHGSGSSRMSQRNRFVAERLGTRGLATLLFDLLTEDEGRDHANVFDLGLLSTRLLAAARWVTNEEALSALPLGFFGASTGAGAALLATSELKRRVAAVVSRGGRPDLVLPVLPDVTAPTLLIVGGRDELVIEMNRRALTELGGPKELVIVPGATHLFEEPGALEQVAELASSWFARHCQSPVGSVSGWAPPRW